MPEARPSAVGGGGCGATGAAACDGDQASDAAHLLMCAVMAAMLLAPSALNVDAVRGVLLSMAVVLTLLLGERLLGWDRSTRPEAVRRVAAIGHHLAAVGAMLSTMSGHSGAGHGVVHHGWSAPVFAVFFLADALVVVLSAFCGKALLWLPHEVRPRQGQGPPVSVLPHLIMDLGMFYMLLV
ncbi:DUF5134 domain-containing protein [Nocardia sp. NPDC058499]|uniref:DUF5134 domain-containing protein n=1 Tax=Nocardia sp. NPDC058499 TaxID=3346530 RepID=UPI003656C7D8